MNQWDKFKQSLPKISTKDISANYNDGRIIGAKELSTLAQIYPKKCKNLIVMLAKRKRKPDQPPKWFTTYMDGFRKEIYEYINNPPQPPKWFRDFENKIFLWIDKQEKFNKDILSRLDNLVAKNHLIE